MPERVSAASCFAIAQSMLTGIWWKSRAGPFWTKRPETMFARADPNSRQFDLARRRTRDRCHETIQIAGQQISCMRVD